MLIAARNAPFAPSTTIHAKKQTVRRKVWRGWAVACIMQTVNRNKAFHKNEPKGESNMGMKLFVQMVELLQASAKMNEAMERYNEAKEAVQKAAETLASNWEGDAREAFWANQQEAYGWYSQIMLVVLEIIDLVKKVAQEYRDAEDRIKSIVSGG